jgi:hypothetical protein
MFKGRRIIYLPGITFHRGGVFFRSNLGGINFFRVQFREGKFFSEIFLLNTSFYPFFSFLGELFSDFFLGGGVNFFSEKIRGGETFEREKCPPQQINIVSSLTSIYLQDPSVNHHSFNASF